MRGASWGTDTSVCAFPHPSCRATWLPSPGMSPCLGPSPFCFPGNSEMSFSCPSLPHSTGKRSTSPPQISASLRLLPLQSGYELEAHLLLMAQSCPSPGPVAGFRTHRLDAEGGLGQTQLAGLVLMPPTSNHSPLSPLRGLVLIIFNLLPSDQPLHLVASLTREEGMT